MAIGNRKSVFAKGRVCVLPDLAPSARSTRPFCGGEPFYYRSRPNTTVFSVRRPNFSGLQGLRQVEDRLTNRRLYCTPPAAFSPGPERSAMPLGFMRGGRNDDDRATRLLLALQVGRNMASR